MSANWTSDASGHYVDWTQPPYREPGSGLLHLVLKGEDYHQISWQTFSQRRAEYMKLTRRQMRTA